MSYRSLELGVNAVQSGQLGEGARLLRIALKSGELTPDMRALAYLWLAEAQPDAAHKRACYSEALIADPNNAEAKNRLSRLLAAELPPMPNSLPEQDTTGMMPQAAPPVSAPMAAYAPQPATPPAHPYTANIAEHIVGVFGGPNGPGSGFFAAAEGIIATTRYVTAGCERMTVELQPGRQVMAYLVRAFPQIDLALLRVDFAPNTSLAITPLPRVPDDTPLLAASYQRALMNGRQRATKRILAAHWIPTTFDRWEDAGGAPIFDQNYYLVGMATRNTARSSGHYFALHLAAIRAQVDEYLAASRAENRAYCPTCGAGSKAGVMGFFYCETCGATLPNARHTQRYPLPQAEALYETGKVRCTRCGAQVGFHQGRCLRCGQPPATSPLA